MMVADQEKKKTVPDFRPGDTVRVSIKVIEGESERIQAFEGTVISRRGHGELQSFTVRKISFGVGVERTFPLNSPHIDKIDVVKSGKVRRARLYYLRNLTGKAARVDEREEPVGGNAPSSSKPAAEAKTAAADGKAAAAPKKAAKPAAETPKAEPGAQAVAPARK